MSAYSIREVEGADRRMKAIAMGRGKPFHFQWLDIDTRDVPTTELDAATHASALVYATEHGYHVVWCQHQLTKYQTEVMDSLKKYSDQDCPHSAIRIYPNEDYSLLEQTVPTFLPCLRAWAIFDSIFQFKYFPLNGGGGCERLRFGIYEKNEER